MLNGPLNTNQEPCHRLIQAKKLTLKKQNKKKGIYQQSTQLVPQVYFEKENKLNGQYSIKRKKIEIS